MAHMRPNDRLPKNKPFPVGTMVEAERERRAEEWLNLIDSLSHAAFFDKIKTYSNPTAITSGTGQTTYATHQAALRLCKTWDEASGSDRTLAVNGFVVATAFNREVQYLPPCSLNLAEDLHEMGRDKNERARLFAQTAWHSMLAYPYVHDTFDRLFRHSFIRFYIPSEGADYFKAGMALPFMTSWASSLSDYLRKDLYS